MNWIELIKVLSPIIIALLQPHLKDVAMMTAKSMADVEKTGMPGPDKLEHVVSDILPMAAKSNPTMKIDDVKDGLVKGIDSAVAVANMLKQMHNFEHGL